MQYEVDPNWTAEQRAAAADRAARQWNDFVNRQRPSASVPVAPPSGASTVPTQPSLLDQIAGGSANRQLDINNETAFNALVNQNNAQAALIGVPTQALPQSMDAVRVNQILNAAPGTQFGFAEQPVPRTGGPSWEMAPGVNPNRMLPGQPQAPQQSAPSSLFDTWQQYATNAGWSAAQQQPVAQQPTAPAQMSLGQVQPQAASQSATSTTAYPGQRYQQQSLGGFGWQQPQQRQGQQQAAPMQTGQQGLGMGGGYRQRRQSGLGMLGQQLIA